MLSYLEGSTQQYDSVAFAPSIRNILIGLLVVFCGLFAFSLRLFIIANNKTTDIKNNWKLFLSGLFANVFLLLLFIYLFFVCFALGLFEVSLHLFGVLFTVVIIKQEGLKALNRSPEKTSQRSN